MSILQYEIYVQSCLSLAKSIRLKHSPIVELMNQEINRNSAITKITVDDQDPTSWKYYMNLAGVYHALDIPMTVVSLDTTQTIQFTRQNILQHRATYKAYQFGSQYYAELVKRYPNQEDLIRGILRPIDINVAIDAKDYTILDYDKDLVEGNEINLINELQLRIDQEVSRWNVRSYVYSDPYYPLALLAMILQFIPAWIIEIRKHNCLTYKAHSFHIWNHLDSYGHLSQYRDYLSRNQALWLYRNIDWVMNNTGKQHTFETLVAQLCTPRGIPIGSYSVRHNVSEMPSELVPMVDAVRTPLNMLDRINPEPVVRDLRYVMEKSINLAPRNKELLESHLTIVENAISKSEITNLPIKVYESEMLDTTDAQSIRLGDVLIMNWAYLSNTNRYTSSINVQNPYTSDLMTMSVKEAFVVWLYAMNKIMGHVLINVPEMVATDVLRLPPPDLAKLRSISESKYISAEEIQAKIDIQPVIGIIISTETFNELCNQIHKTMLELEYQWESKTELRTRANHELVAKAFYYDASFKLTPSVMTYEQYFTDRGWSIENLNTSDLSIIVGSIYNLALGIDTTNVKTIKEIQQAILKLMAQLGTYDTQYIQTINTSPEIPLDTELVLLDGLPQSPTSNTDLIDYIGTDVLDVNSKSHLNFELDPLDPAMAIVVDRDHYIDVDIELTSSLKSERMQIFYCDLGGVEIDFPNVGNYEQLQFSGSVVQPVVELKQQKDLKDVIPNNQLDGLHYPEE